MSLRRASNNNQASRFDTLPTAAPHASGMRTPFSWTEVSNRLSNLTMRSWENVPGLLPCARMCSYAENYPGRCVCHNDGKGSESRE